jgi:putative RNA 2'-phosphotransferase
MDRELVSTSKFLSLVLRHRPDTIGLTLDENGWADIDELVRLSTARGKPLTRALLLQIVAADAKQRYALSTDGERIRANQGHSIQVDLDLEPLAPPSLLFHGTALRVLEAIRAEGLIRGRRLHVHLSQDEATARVVGARHGRPVVLTVAAKRMWDGGHRFYLSDNDVWLTEHVPVAFITFPS